MAEIIAFNRGLLPQVGYLGTTAALVDPIAATQRATINQCAGKSALGCCGALDNGIPISGVPVRDNICLSAPWNLQGTGQGINPPNTMAVNSLGPRIKVTMGSCFYEGISSPILNEVGAFQSVAFDPLVQYRCF